MGNCESHARPMVRDREIERSERGSEVIGFAAFSRSQLLAGGQLVAFASLSPMASLARVADLASVDELPSTPAFDLLWRVVDDIERALEFVEDSAPWQGAAPAEVVSLLRSARGQLGDFRQLVASESRPGCLRRVRDLLWEVDQQLRASWRSSYDATLTFLQWLHQRAALFELSEWFRFLGESTPA